MAGARLPVKMAHGTIQGVQRPCLAGNAVSEGGRLELWVTFQRILLPAVNVPFTIDVGCVFLLS